MTLSLGDIQSLVSAGDWRVFDHAYDRMVRRMIVAGTYRQADLITAYRPDPTKWHPDNRTRRQSDTPTTPQLESTLEPATKFVREGRWVAEVDVTLVHTGHDWSPYLQADDVRRLAAMRSALRRGDIVAAAKLARVFEVKSVAV